MSADAERRAVRRFEERYGRAPDVVVRAPGRVNLIGEHTDYNDGFVLPMAIPHATWIAAARRQDGRVELISEGYPDDGFSVAPVPSGVRGWAGYVAGVGWALERAGARLVGWSGSVASDVPLGASLSSSAALELATARTFVELAGTPFEPIEAAKLAQQAEQDYVGMPCGIMDQLIVARAEAGSALLIDCRSLEVSPVPVPDGAVVVVLDTGTRRELVTSAYAERRAACERVSAALGVPALRDATADDLDAHADDLDPVDRRRAEHVLVENERTLAAAEAMRAGDPHRLGELMHASHRSLADLYEVSGPALDLMVDIASAAPGCYGARMTGGGFAGCAVALVDAAAVDGFLAEVKSRYDAISETDSALYVCEPSAGVSVTTRGS